MGDDRHKVGGVVVTRHVSHGKSTVGAAFGAEPVAHCNGIDRSGELRQTDELGVAVSSTAAGQRKRITRDRVGVGTTVGHMRHVCSRGTVGVAIPARRQLSGSTVGCASHSVEILEVWRHDKVATGKGCARFAPATGIGGRADGSHTDLISCGRREARKGGGMCRDYGSRGNAVACVHNLPCIRRAVVSPVNSDGRSSGCCRMYVARGRTGGDIVEVEVVDIGIPRAAGTKGTDCHILATASVTRQGYLKQSPVGVACNGDSVE